jgi:hypothetical protein
MIRTPYRCTSRSEHNQESHGLSRAAATSNKNVSAGASPMPNAPNAGAPDKNGLHAPGLSPVERALCKNANRRDEEGHLTAGCGGVG